MVRMFFVRDSNILYGVQRKKRKRKKSSDESSISLDSSSTKRERSKKKVNIQKFFKSYKLKIFFLV